MAAELHRLRRPRVALAVAVGSAVIAVGLLSACTTGSADGSAADSTAAPVCPSATSTPTGGAAELVVTPAELCIRDGSAWRDSVFTTVVNTPDWGAEKPAGCDDARMDAFYGAWNEAQPAGVSLELAAGPDPDAPVIGAVGVSVLAAPDPAAPVGLIDAEVATCLTAPSGQTELTHGEWHGVRGPSSGGAGTQLTWWLAGADSWALVQGYESEGLPAADATAYEAALGTLLDAQAALIG